MAGATYWTQADALLRKNLTFQKRNKCSNIALVVFPILLCSLLAAIQVGVEILISKAQPDTDCDSNNKNECGSPAQPPKLLVLLQIPDRNYRAVQTDFLHSPDLPKESCRKTNSCPVSILLTGNNESFSRRVGDNMLTKAPFNKSDPYATFADNVFGTPISPSLGSADSVFNDYHMYYVQSECNSTSISVNITIDGDEIILKPKCAQGLLLWRNSSSEINDELYKGYLRGNNEKKINEFAAAYDFLNSNEKSFNINIWHNATDANDKLTHVPRSVNLASNAYLRFMKGVGTKIQFGFMREMPTDAHKLSFDISSILSVQFFIYVVIALFPTVLTFLVYENQNRLRMMMKMHGLGDVPYWMISYAYFLAISVVYMLGFVLFGSLVGLNIFKKNDYSIQFVFFFLYINLQIAVAFLLAPLFSTVQTARVVGYIVVFGSGLLGLFLFIDFVEDASFPRKWIIAMELYPGFSLYRGFYELGQYASEAATVGIPGMTWEDLNDSSNGMKEVLIIMFVEWLLVLFGAYYVDKAMLSGRGMKNCCLFGKKSSPLTQSSSEDSSIRMENFDVSEERQKVEQLVQERSTGNGIVCDNLAKVYPGRDGNPPKAAVKGLSIALPRGECFGMLGPNGAGKTSFISMMIGLLKPSSGNAFADGKSILSDMDDIYTNMGVCPQHDLIWESLTAREHLLFYGRLKNLKGAALNQAVEESLKSVNLYHGGVGDKLSGEYSGGMKRRLSVAISLMGDPKVVYMDEPSTGLDPASRNNLWNVVKRAKQDRAIILTTHSMEEAEVLCDRLGIFVDGSLQCIGNPKELKARYGGSFVLTITTSSSHEAEVERMARRLSRNAQRVYHISGTQKFELPKHEVRISDVFRKVQEAKRRFTVYAWGLTDTTLEDVFIKVARDAQAFNTLS